MGLGVFLEKITFIVEKMADHGQAN